MTHHRPFARAALAAAAALAGLLVMPPASHSLAQESSGVAYSFNVDVAPAVTRQADLSAPTVVSIKRQDPMAEHTNLDSLTWRVVFSEGVVDVDEEDFFVSGGSTEVSYTEAVGGSETTYDVTGSGGSLSRFDGEVSLEFAANQEIWASAPPNADLDPTLPTGANYETYRVDNTAPTLTIMPADASTATFTATVAFSEDVTGFDDAGDATATNATVGTPMKKGADASEYTVLVTVSDPGASKTIRLKVAAGKATDLAGNYNAANSQDIEYTAPAATPGVPTITSVTPGNATLTVTWTAPADVGGSAISGYDVRHKLTSAPDIDANWTEAANTGDDLSHTIGSLTNGTSYDVQVRASNDAGDGAWSDTTTGAPALPTAPRVISITRKTPMTEHTNADTLTWTVEFSENVQNVTQDDFTTTGTTATRTVTGSNKTYDVSVSGGNLASLNATVTLDFATSQNIEATASGNAGLDPAMPQGVANTFVVDNEAPTVTSIKRQTPLEERTASDALVWRVEFSEGVKDVTVGDFDASGTSATATGVEADGTSTTAYNVTVNGGDLAGLNGRVELGFASDQDIKDRAGNDLVATLPTGANNEIYTMDNAAPTVTSIKRQTPSEERVASDALVWRVEFSEGVKDVTVGDFDASGTSATATLVEADGTSTAVYDVTVSGGDLAGLNGKVELGFASDRDIKDRAGNDLVATLPTGGNYETYTMDNPPPRVTSIKRQDPATEHTKLDSLTWRVVFSQDVQNVDEEDFTVSGGSAEVSYTEAVGDSATTYDVTGSGGSLFRFDGEVSLEFAANQDIEAAATPNADLDAKLPTGANYETYMVDNTAPMVTSILRQTPLEERTAADALVWRVEFSEEVRDVTVGDFDASGTSATATVVEGDGTSTTVYDVTVSGGDLAGLNGKVELGFASNRDIKDRAGNGLVATLPTGGNYETYTMDNPPPRVTSIKRQDPATEHTKLDSLTWRVVFSQDVQNVDEEDFTVSGATADVFDASPFNSSATTYDVTVNGGSLDRANAEVKLDFHANQDIEATAAPNADLDAKLPTGANYETYKVDNAAPTVTSILRQTPSEERVAVDALVWRVEFSEGVEDVAVRDFDASGTSATATLVGADGTSKTVYDVTVNGGGPGRAERKG